jgi:hypothetical protein
MKRLLLLLAIPVFLSFTGCIEILEEVFLEKGGSGSYQITVDMSALMDESLQDMLGQFAGEGEDMSLEGIEMDSLIRYADIAGDQIASLERPEVFESAQMRMEISDARDVMKFTISMDFQELEDIDYFSAHLSEIAGEEFAGGMGSAGILPSGNLMSLKGKKLTRHPVVTPSDTPAFSEEEMAMARMMFEGATYTTIYHFPGKVKKTSIPDAVIDGNMVSITHGLMDMMTEDIDVAGTIKFKWK